MSADQSVRVRTGTSSISLGFICAFSAPGGSRSSLVRSFSPVRTIAASMSSPTWNSSVIMPIS